MLSTHTPIYFTYGLACLPCRDNYRHIFGGLYFSRAIDLKHTARMSEVGQFLTAWKLKAGHFGFAHVFRTSFGLC